MEIDVIFGANLNNLENREKIYGGFSYGELTKQLLEYAFKKGVKLNLLCYNSEGEIIQAVQEAQNPIIINAGAFSHTSLAIADALSCVSQKKIEVHLTNIHARGRHVSLTAAACTACIAGFGVYGYYMAIDYLIGKDF